MSVMDNMPEKMRRKERHLPNLMVRNQKEDATTCCPHCLIDRWSLVKILCRNNTTVSAEQLRQRLNEKGKKGNKTGCHELPLHEGFSFPAHPFSSVWQLISACLSLPAQIKGKKNTMCRMFQLHHHHHHHHRASATSPPVVTLFLTCLFASFFFSTTAWGKCQASMMCHCHCYTPGLHRQCFHFMHPNNLTECVCVCVCVQLWQKHFLRWSAHWFLVKCTMCWRSSTSLNV